VRARSVGARARPSGAGCPCGGGPSSRTPVTAPDTARPGLVWRWSDAALGVAYALPAAAAMANSVPRGLAFAIGVIPAAAFGVPARRNRRPILMVVGVLAGISIFVGAALHPAPWVAVPAVFAMAVGAAELAQRRPIGQLVMVLALPLVGVGLSFDDLSSAAGLGLLMALGSAYACAITMLLPEKTPAVTPARGPSPSLLGYGIRLGLAAAIAAAIGFALDLDHVGWACAAALLVMRPSTEMVQLRGLGRLASVFVGAAAATALAQVTTSTAVYAVVIIAVVAAAAATHTSRWYVTSAFSTFIALSLLVYATPADASSRFLERMSETLLGVALAYVFGLLVPTFSSRRAVAGKT
jgi:hypothetical protein